MTLAEIYEKAINDFLPIALKVNNASPHKIRVEFENDIQVKAFSRHYGRYVIYHKSILIKGKLYFTPICTPRHNDSIWIKTEKMSYKKMLSIFRKIEIANEKE